MFCQRHRLELRTAEAAGIPGYGRGEDKWRVNPRYLIGAPYRPHLRTELAVCPVRPLEADLGALLELQA